MAPCLVVWLFDCGYRMQSLSKILSQTILVLIILFGVVTATELGFRVGGYQGNQFRSILFGDDISSVLLFEESPLLWWKLRANVTITFLEKKVATDDLGLRVCLHHNTNRAENRLRVLCLGDSSTFGWRLDYNQTYPFLLEQKLRQTFREVRVYNGGVPGYTSFQSRLQFQDIMDQVKPHVVIIYSSNNETSLAQHSDVKRFELTGRMLRLRMWLNSSLAYQFMKGLLIRPKPFKMTGTISVNQLSQLSPRVRLEEYRENLVEIIKLVRQKAIAPLLVTVPSHIGHPYLFCVPAANPLVESMLEAVEERIVKEQYEGALADLKKAEHLAPDYYKIHFLIGVARHMD